MEITFGVDANACPPATNPRSRKVHEYTWGYCPICRMKATAEGVQDVVEGSEWCAGHCTRRGPWACNEEATLEMVYAWRAWAVAQFALYARDAQRKARKGTSWPTMGDPWRKEMAAGRAIKGRVVG